MSEGKKGKRARPLPEAVCEAVSSLLYGVFIELKIIEKESLSLSPSLPLETDPPLCRHLSFCRFHHGLQICPVARRRRRRHLKDKEDTTLQQFLELERQKKGGNKEPKCFQRPNPSLYLISRRYKFEEGKNFLGPKLKLGEKKFLVWRRD